MHDIKRSHNLASFVKYFQFVVANSHLQIRKLKYIIIIIIFIFISFPFIIIMDTATLIRVIENK